MNGHEHSQDPFVLSIVSLTSLIVVKMLTVLVSTISNSQVFFSEKKKKKKKKKNILQMQKLLTFSAKILAYMPHLIIKGLTIL